MSIEHTQILSALKKVIEPDLGKDVVSLKLVSDLKVEGNKISFSLQIKNAAMHARKRMQEACEFAIERTIGKGYELEISISALKQVDAAQNTLSNIKNFIAIVSGKGGVGKSTISANIAAGLSKKGYKVGIVDADIYGPSLPIMFDIQHFRPLSRKVNNKELIVPAENYGVKILSIGFFAELDQAVIWRGPMAVKALKQLIFDADWGDLDYLIIDTPPGTGDVHLSAKVAPPAVAGPSDPDTGSVLAPDSRPDPCFDRGRDSRYSRPSAACIHCGPSELPETDTSAACMELSLSIDGCNGTRGAARGSCSDGHSREARAGARNVQALPSEPSQCRPSRQPLWRPGRRSCLFGALTKGY